MNPEEPRRARHSGVTLTEILIVLVILGVVAAIAVPIFRGKKDNKGRASCLSNMKQIGIGVLQYLQDYDDTYPVCNRTYLKPTQTDGSVVQSSWIRHVHPYTKRLDIFLCPETPRPDEKQIIFGNNGSVESQILVARRSIGANGLLFYLANDPSGRKTQPISQSKIGQIAQLPIIADSSSFIWTDPRYLIFSSYVSKKSPGNSVAWSKELTAQDRANPNPAFARHDGGVNVIFGDGHTAFKKQTEINEDPTRTTPHFQLNYKLPFVPIDRVENGNVVLPQDDRLK